MFRVDGLDPPLAGGEAADPGCHLMRLGAVRAQPEDGRAAAGDEDTETTLLP